MTHKVIRFRYDSKRGYVCSEPGNQDGAYIKSEDYIELMKENRQTLKENVDLIRTIVAIQNLITALLEKRKETKDEEAP